MSTGTPSTWDLTAYEGLISTAEGRRRELLVEARGRSADLPLLFWQQQAHFTTPASDFAMLQKAIEGGMSATAKILAKFGISASEVATTFGCTEADVRAVLDGDPRPPLVMVDGEDAQALRADVVERGRENAVRAFTELDWGKTLRFYRPSGLNLDFCVRDMAIVLTQVARGRKLEDYPIDGIIWPKVEHPSQLAWVCDTLGEIERALGLAENRIKLQFLVESGWAVAHLPELVRVAPRRLAGIIFGIADYSADINLPGIDNDHFVCDWARAGIVNLAGAVGVPSIDNMTVNYPVADKSLNDADNRTRILGRLAECYRDAQHGFGLGMTGKWVGHPAQLFAVMLADRTGFPQQAIDKELRKIESYAQAVANELGATIIEGVMSDRATDRHARNRLRRAIATGHLDAARGLGIGLISAAEAEMLRR
jgi:citrate lyase subunit beta/citryl-CoA lyase